MGTQTEQAQVALLHGTLVDIARDRDAWRGIAVKLGIISAILAIALILAVSGLLTPKREYFATSPGGQITPIIPLDRPSVSTSAVSSFALAAISDSLSLNFRQWRQQLSSARVHYTNPGFSGFTNQLEKMGWLSTIETEFLTVTVSAVDKPVVTAEGVGRNGVYGYVVEMPITLTLEGKSERRRQDMKVRVTIIRVPTVDSERGIAVDQVVMV